MAFALVNVKEVHSAGLGFFWKVFGQEDVQEIATTTTPSLPVLVKKVKVVPLILEKIKWCESRDRQFNADGTVKRGKENPKDVGAYQINEFYHLESSIKLGMDIYTLAGNTDYALYLYNTQGTRPWNWSKWCWGGNETLAELKLKYK